MNNIMLFEENKVEVFELNGKVLFNPYHVGKCLDIIDVKSTIRNFNEKQVVKVKNSEVGTMHFRKLNNAGENFLTESGVYKIIFKSRKKEAEKFQDWVTDEVLPSIRKNGGYITDLSKFKISIRNKQDYQNAIQIIENLQCEIEKSKIELLSENNDNLQYLQKKLIADIINSLDTLNNLGIFTGTFYNEIYDLMYKNYKIDLDRRKKEMIKNGMEIKSILSIIKCSELKYFLNTIFERYTNGNNENIYKLNNIINNYIQNDLTGITYYILSLINNKKNIMNCIA